VRAVFRYWLWLLLALVVLQIAFAGFGAFDVAEKVASEGASIDEESVDDSWGLHIGFGYLVLLASLIAVVLALAARVGRQRVLHALGIFGLMIVQILLAWFGSEVPIIGALHPVNAFLILGAVLGLTMRERKGEQMTAPPPAV
jgi:Family of unknown function (DUF6220)